MSPNNKIIFENLGRNGKPTTKSVCIIKCDGCQIEFRRKYVTFIKHQEDELIPGNFCNRCLPSLDVHKQKVSSGLRRMLKEDPGWNRRNSLSKKGKINLGDKNGMKSPEARKKVSNFRKNLFRDPAEREKVAKKVSAAWRDGKYDNAPVGKCKWFNTLDHNGKEIKVQGTWELAYANWLTKNQIPFLCHKGRISYRDDQGNERNYYPDFYLINEGLYIDIKNRYHYEKQRRKFEILEEQRTDIKIKILFKDDLDKLGVFNDQDD